MLVPLLFMTLPTLDMSMVVFPRTIMPEAGREGARYATTPQKCNRVPTRRGKSIR
jgi:hypothetical protein